MKQIKNKASILLANVIKEVATLSVDSRCSFFYHQPKMPNALEKAENKAYEKNC